jgi:phospholipid/cholesterol/gamma-HCH transport system ATP-binding protein
MTSANTVQREPVNVAIQHVSKFFGNHCVLEDIDLTINPGEIFVIMGPSGAGKSVLLKQIIGLEKPTTGNILINGMDAGSPLTHQTIRTGLVFQDGALFNSLTVYDNLALYPTEHQLYSKAVIREKVMQVLEILSLQKAVDKMPSELSGGMKKRVSVARALMMEPQLLLYDEPTSELDPILAATISELIATVRRETHLTSIVVSHDRDLANAIGDRIALLRDGKMIFTGTPQAFNSSKDPLVIDFLNPIIDIDHPRFRQKEKES